MTHHDFRYQKAFTIVELLVVIVVIGVLASITLVTYTGIANKAKDAAITSDLTNTSKRLKLHQVENSSYPADSTKLTNCPTPVVGSMCLNLSPGDTLGAYTVNNSVFPQTFCLTIKNGTSMIRHIDQDGVINNDACSYSFPVTLAATASSRSQINLSWPVVSGADSLTLQRATNNTFTTGLTTLTAPAAAATTASSTGLTSSTTYYYRMKVTMGGDDSNWSNTASNTTLDFPAPTGLAMTSKTASSINLSWNSVAGAVNYNLQRSSTADFASHVDATIASGTTVYASTGLTSGTYYYRVNVTDAGGTSVWSGTLIASTSIIIAYTTPGSYTWVVPTGVSSVQLEAMGGQGGNGGGGLDSPGYGGAGGYGKGTLAVSAGQSLSILVGQAGGNGPDGSGPPGGGCVYDGDVWAGDSGSDGGQSYIKLGAIDEVIGYGGGGGSAAGFSYGSYDNNNESYCDITTYSGGGGGGGSGYANTGTLTSTSISDSYQSGNGRVVITY